MYLRLGSGTLAAGVLGGTTAGDGGKVCTVILTSPVGTWLIVYAPSLMLLEPLQPSLPRNATIPEGNASPFSSTLPATLPVLLSPQPHMNGTSAASKPTPNTSRK